MPALRGDKVSGVYTQQGREPALRGAMAVYAPKVSARRVRVG